MSLLMQALKKAERAKQNSLSEEEIDRPSEAFDEMLALTPEPGPSTAVSAPAPMAFSLEPMDGLSLEPLAPPVAAAADAAPRPSPSPLPPVSDHKEPGLTMDLALDPIAAPPIVKAAGAPAPAAAAASQAAMANSHAPASPPA
ncbi:tetratricopeptide repeat protein, partial [Duganella sp. FT109W]|nr:tetratricopeptide repeat protein [Duganella margarita]